MEQENLNSQVSTQAAEFAHIRAMAAQIEQPKMLPGVVPEQAPPSGPSTAEILQPLIEGGFGILAPNWGVSPAECQELSAAYGLVIDKYCPDMDLLDKYGPEIAAVTATAMIVLPRMKTPRKLEPPKDVKPAPAPQKPAKRESTGTEIHGREKTH